MSTAREYLKERGYDLDELATDEGKIFAVFAARAQDYQRKIAGAEHAQTRAVITEFCKGVLLLSENAKPSLLGRDFEKAVLVNAFVRLFADPAELEKFFAKK